ncbi:MAG: alpha/beta hydrolase [Mycobacterium kyogaense]|uniref:alpha/beta hydrolase n=1 Tax=Mycobacterium kyogaense TaxID=2212479 RepID=UPI002FFB4503
MYTFDIDPHAMFEDRTHQFAGFGIPLADIDGVRARTTDMWADAPGGWSFEWSALAESYAEAADHQLAAYAYGCAHFPCLNTDARIRALALQLEHYELAAKNFPVHFERRVLTLPYRGNTIDMPVHLFSTDGNLKGHPVLLAGGGVDTFKMDFHPFCVALTQGTGMTALAIDLPGTGETSVPLNVHADEVISGIIDAARTLGDGRVAHFGLSFGANFSAASGLSGLVDAAVNIGGPLVDAFAADNLGQLPYGMRDIVGNALRLDEPPTLAELTAAMAGMSRAGLLVAERNSPMMVINGADDYFVPTSDTLVFGGRPHTEVHLLPDSGHCAMTKIAEVVPMIIGWLRTQFPDTAVPPTTQEP